MRNRLRFFLPQPLNPRRVAQAAVGLTFVAFTIVGAAGLLCPADSSEGLQETAPAPAWPNDVASTVAFPRQFGDFVRYHFGLRGPLLDVYGRIKSAFGQTTTDRVLIGRDGWLFLGDKAVVRDVRGLNPFTPDDLERWRRSLEARRDFVAQHGGAYVFVIAPNKHTIYPERLPVGLDRAARATRLDQLVGYLSKHSDVSVVDLRPALREARQQEQAYLQRDTHWNRFGAYAAYRRIADALAGRFPELQPIGPEQLRRRKMTLATTDLQKMMGVDPQPETQVMLNPIGRPMEVESAPGRRGFGVDRRTRCAAGEIPRAWITHDSFGNALVPFLGAHVQAADWQTVPADAFDPDAIAADRPDLVLQLIVERKLVEIDPQTLWMPDEEVDATDRRRQETAPPRAVP